MLNKGTRDFTSNTVILPKNKIKDEISECYFCRILSIIVIKQVRGGGLGFCDKGA